ncbi:9406_t:CDS:2, partial [Ambispora gerdemannii]
MSTATTLTRTPSVNSSPYPSQQNNNNPPPDSGNSSGGPSRRRGPINKRACQRCRQGKIKCDGNAETGHPCSNCDANTCKYDNSPRKNKQNGVEIKQFEKKVLKELYEQKEYFVRTQSLSLFDQLLQVLMESRCFITILQLIKEHLVRLPLIDNQNRTVDIMQGLEQLANISINCEINSNYGPLSRENTEILHRINNYLNGYGGPTSTPNNTSLAFTSTSPISSNNNGVIDQITSPSNNLGLNALSIHSPPNSDANYSFSNSTIITATDNNLVSNEGEDLAIFSPIASETFPGIFQYLDPSYTSNPMLFDPTDPFLNPSQSMDE